MTEKEKQSVESLGNFVKLFQREDIDEKEFTLDLEQLRVYIEGILAIPFAEKDLFLMEFKAGRKDMIIGYLSNLINKIKDR